MENIRFINWKSYFDDIQIEEYNLKETNNIKLYNTNDNNMPGYYQINYLNKYLGELVMMYYIWKHNLKSEYICISQYRKDFCHINFDMLKNDYIQIWHYWIDENFNNAKKPIDRMFNDENYIDPDNFWKNKFIEYLNIQNIYDDSVINNIMNESNHHELMASFVFAMNWNIFCKLCEFIFGFLDYVFPNESWKNPNKILELRNKKRKLWDSINTNDKRIDWIMIDNDRYLVFIIEKILMVCLSSMHKIYQNYSEDIYINKNIITKGNYFWHVAEFYKINKKINTKYIYCRIPDDQYDEIYNFFKTNHYVFPNIEIIHENDIINGDLIELEIDEYIDIDDTYSIKDMSIEDIRKHIKKFILK